MGSHFLKCISKNIKKGISYAPVLIDFNKDFMIYTNAIGEAI